MKMLKIKRMYALKAFTCCQYIRCKFINCVYKRKSKKTLDLSSEILYRIRTNQHESNSK